MASRSKRLFQDVYKDILGASKVVSVGAVGAGTTNTSNTITVPGVAVGDPVITVSASASLGAVVLSAEVTAADTVTLKVANTTAGSITPPASTTYSVVVGKLNAEVTT